MKLQYKGESWEVVAPNTSSLLKEIIGTETKKKYLTLKNCARMLYTFNQAWVIWQDSNYIDFVGHLSEQTRQFYTTKESSSKGVSYRMERNNVQTIKNDFEYFVKLFSIIIPSMIIDRKRKLYFTDK